MDVTTRIGKVMITTGSWYDVRLQNGEILKCRLKGKLKLEETKSTNPVAVGDNVEVVLDTAEHDYMIEDVLPRHNYIVRQSPRQKHYKHIIAANIDQMFVMACISKPRTSLGFIDRCIAAAECFHIPLKIIVNKLDTHSKKDDATLSLWQEIYAKAGYEIITTSTINSLNITKVQQLLDGKTTLIAGHSGVGKSSLMNVVSPGLELRTNKISDKWSKGMHTTTFATMYALWDSTFIIDTPGIKEFFVIEIEPQELGGYFVEFTPHISKCAYNDCLHQNEQNCGVKDAVENGVIHVERYLNYLNILEQIQQVNYWERM